MSSVSAIRRSLAPSVLPVTARSLMCTIPDYSDKYEARRKAFFPPGSLVKGSEENYTSKFIKGKPYGEKSITQPVLPVKMMNRYFGSLRPYKEQVAKLSRRARRIWPQRGWLPPQIVPRHHFRNMNPPEWVRNMYGKDELKLYNRLGFPQDRKKEREWRAQFQKDFVHYVSKDPEAIKVLQQSCKPRLLDHPYAGRRFRAPRLKNRIQKKIGVWFLEAGLENPMPQKKPVVIKPPKLWVGELKVDRRVAMIEKACSTMHEQIAAVREEKRNARHLRKEIKNSLFTEKRYGPQ